MDTRTIDWDEILPKWRRDLVYVDYRDGFDAGTVEELLRGNYPDDTDEWINDRQWESAHELATELTAEDGPLAGMDLDEIAYQIQELDTSNPYMDLLRNTGHILFRFTPSEDDMMFLDEELEDPAAACEALGLDPAFIQTVSEILPEIAGYRCGGGGNFLATFIFSANPADLVWKFEDDDIVEVSNPFLWITNPWCGNGYGVVAKGLTARLRFGDIHTDKGAWGYGADDVFGGLLLADSEIGGAS